MGWDKSGGRLPRRKCHPPFLHRNEKRALYREPRRRPALGFLYPLTVSCQRHGKDPLAYLKDILTRLPRMTNRDDLCALTPRLWQPAAL